MKVLVLEDEVLLALDVAQMVADAGHAIAGPYHAVEEARDALRARPVDFALLDYRLGAEVSAQLADELAGAGVPFAFITGQHRKHLPDRFDDVPVIDKPVVRRRLHATLRAAAEG